MLLALFWILLHLGQPYQCLVHPPLVGGAAQETYLAAAQASHAGKARDFLGHPDLLARLLHNLFRPIKDVEATPQQTQGA